MKGKKTALAFVLAIVLAFAPLAAADYYELWCLGDGEVADFSALCNPLMDPLTGPSIVCVHFLDSGSICPSSLNICNSLGLGCSSGEGNTTIDSTPPTLEVFSPAEGELYTERTVYIDIDVDESVSLHYKDNSVAPRWKSLCSSCSSYTGERNFDEGFNDITFRAVDGSGNEAFQTVTFNVDSRDPDLGSIEPSSGFASGEFTVEFEESTPDDLIINYGNFDLGFRDHFIDIGTECTEDDDEYECATQIDLSDYDGQQITYFVSLTDLASNIDQTAEKTLQVDYSDPVINSIDHVVDGKRVTFTLSITESYFDEVTYIDYSDDRPREKRLCNSLVGEICEKTVSFNKDGDHDVTITVKDEAGNTATAALQFFTDSKDPRIRDTEPSRGFASGLFEIEFEEQNPETLVLNYGNDGTGMRAHSFDLLQCSVDEDEYYCSEQLDLSDFDGEEIEYSFVLTDRVGQTDEDGEDDLAVDISYPIINEIDYYIDGKNVYFTIDVTEPYLDEITYIDYADDRPRERRLCSRLTDGACEKRVSFKDGDHDVTITVKDEAGHSTAQPIQFFTDSKDPKIKDIEPSRDFASGLFEIEFEEQNPEHVEIEYGNFDMGFIDYELDISEDCTQTDDDEYVCSRVFDLSAYDGYEIEYSFLVTDRVGQTDEDSEDDLPVDTTFPVIESIDYELDDSRAEIFLEATELNLDKITYLNNDDSRPREKTFCSRLTDGECVKRISLNEGPNNLEFYVLDEAGNSIVESLFIFLEL